MNNPKFQYWFFIIFTILYFLVLNKYFGITLDDVKALDANELGDFLAGTFSPLAFLFLILGYLQNNKNLGQNTEALTQQAKALQLQSTSLDLQVKELKIGNDALQAQAAELRNSVEQQMEQVRISNDQLEYYRQKDISDASKEVFDAKPILSLKRNGSSSSGDYFDLKNIGGDALRIECDRPYINIPNLAKGSSLKINTNIPTEFLTLKYQDKFGNPYTMKFEKGKSSIGWYISTDTQSH